MQLFCGIGQHRALFFTLEHKRGFHFGAWLVTGHTALPFEHECDFHFGALTVTRHLPYLMNMNVAVILVH